MEFIDCITEIYMGAAGAAAVLWVLCEKYPRNPNGRLKGMVIWFLLRFAIFYADALLPLQRLALGSAVDCLFSWKVLQGEKRQKVLIAVTINGFAVLADWIVANLIFFLCDERSVILLSQGISTIPRIAGTFFEGSLYLLAAYMFTGKEKQVKLKMEQRLLPIALCAVFLMGVLVLCSFIDYAALPLPWRLQMAFWGFLLAAATTVVYLVEFLKRQRGNVLENTVLKEQISRQELQIAGMEEDNRRIGRLRHDMKRYFVTYLQLIREGQYEFVECDMQRMLGERLDARWHKYTEDGVFNAVVNEKAQRCRENKIMFSQNVVMAKTLDNMELGIMISNLLDNAIEAEQEIAEQSRRISLDIRMEGEMLHVIVKNFIGASVLERNPRLMTTKANQGMLHGIGLKSVRTIVSENKGEMEVFEKGGMFTVHICIPM